ncbi:hypothetical protein AB6D63_02860 [Vibrio splendidus]
MDNKKVSVGLGIGIVLVPFVFAWFTLRKGYSSKARFVSFGWMLMPFLFFAIPTPEKTAVVPAAETAQSSNTSSLPIEQSQDELIESLIQTHSVNYEITRAVRLDSGDRTRFNSNILAPTATTYDQQLATAAKAAKEFQRDNRVQVSSVNLFTQANGIASITINFAPDSKGWSGTTDHQQRFVIE